MESLKFKRLDKNVELIKEYITQTPVSFCDISLGAKYMWRDEFVIDYAFAEETLILKESCKDYKNAFYFPFGKNAENGFAFIEAYCKENGLPLLFCCVDNKTVDYFVKRYPFTEIYNDRNWSDYIYEAEKFKTYSGKKLSGQRNHVNKFKRLYPDYKFNVIEESDYGKIKEFLTEFECGEDFSMWSAMEEEKKVYDYVLNHKKLEQVGGLLELNGKTIAVSLGERVGDTLIVHVEKGLKNYEGVYPVMASEFVKAFATDRIKFVNREEDCGDMGLRISKLQYHPLEVKEKNFVAVKTLFNKIVPPVTITTERLSVTDIYNSDGEDYLRLYTDEKINEYYGYDYREDFRGETPAAEYFLGFMNELKNKGEEYSFAVRKGEKMIGEIVLYNFNWFAGAEVGFRFFPEFCGKGYAAESVLAVIEYLKTKKLKTLRCRAFKQNLPSLKLIKRLGFKKISETDKQFFFEMRL